MGLLATLFALCTATAATLIARYDATHPHGRRHVPGTPFTLRDGPSKTPERYAAWEAWARFGLGAFQGYAKRYLGGGVRRPIDVVLNAHRTCDGRPTQTD